MLQKQELAVAGRNWGHAAVEGSTLVFTENGKTTFRVPLSDVGQVWTPLQTVVYSATRKHAWGTYAHETDLHGPLDV